MNWELLIQVAFGGGLFGMLWKMNAQLAAIAVRLGVLKEVTIDHESRIRRAEARSPGRSRRRDDERAA